MAEGENRELKKTTIGLMVVTALFFDTLQWALAFIIMDWLVGPFAFMTFYIWLRSHGVKFSSPKRAGTMLGAFIIEFIPVVAMLPAWTAAVVVIVLDQKAKKILGKIPGGEKIDSAISKSRDTKIHAKNEEARSKITAITPRRSANMPAQPTSSIPRSPVSSSAKPTLVTPSPSKNMDISSPKNTESEYKGYKPQPDWMRDKSVQKAMGLRDQRLAFAKEMGYDQEKTSRLVSKAEENDFAMKRGVQTSTNKDTTQFLTQLDDNNRKLRSQNEEAA